MKKLLATLLTLILVLSICSAAMAEDPVKLTIAIKTHSQDRIEEGMTKWNEIATQFGIELEWITFSEDVAPQKVQSIVASGDIPDIFWCDENTSKLYGEELFVDIMANLDKMPNYAKLVDGEMPVTGMVGNSMYLISKYCPLNTTTQGNITYRKDILDALNIAEPTTIAEWLDAYRAVHVAYPDMTVVMERGPGNIVDMMLPVFDMAKYDRNNAGVLGTDLDTVVYLPTTQNWKDMLQFYNTLYTEGLLYAGYATIDYATWWDNGVCTDKCFACNTMNFSRADEATATAHANGMENVEWRVAKNVVNPYNNTREILICSSAWSDYGFTISKDCKNIDLALAFVDYFYGPEFIQYQEDMNDERALDTPLLYAAHFYINPYPSSEKEIYRDHFQKNMDLVKLVPVVCTTPEGAQTITDATEGLADYVSLMRDNFIMGVTSFDEWDAYVEECESLGCNTIVEIYNGYKNN